MKITNVNDYIDRIIEKHPELTKEQIKYILHVGMISFDTHLRRGYGIKLSSPKMRMYTGSKVTPDLNAQYKNTLKKIRRKAELRYRTDKKVFDGFYYFYLTEEKVQQLKPFNRKNMKVDKLMIFKSYEECFGAGTGVYIFKFYYPTDLGFRTLLTNEIIRDYEFMGKKENGKLIKSDYVKRSKK